MLEEFSYNPPANPLYVGCDFRPSCAGIKSISGVAAKGSPVVVEESDCAQTLAINTSTRGRGLPRNFIQFPFFVHYLLSLMRTPESIPALQFCFQAAHLRHVLIKR